MTLGKLALHINASSGVPIYRQIIDAITGAVFSGQLRPSDQLPAVRAVAKDLTVNPLTVLKAYNHLEMQGILVTRRGCGTFVADKPPGLEKGARQSEIEKKIRERITALERAGFGTIDIKTVLRKLLEEL